MLLQKQHLKLSTGELIGWTTGWKESRMELIPFSFYFKNSRLQPTTNPQQLLLLLWGGNKNKVRVFDIIYLFVECRDSNKYFLLFIVFFWPHFFTVAPPRPPPAMTINEALRATPRLPAIGTPMLKSFSLLLMEWQNRGLKAFWIFQFMNELPSLAQAYSKQKYLFDTITAPHHCEGDEQQAMLSLEESAVSLDCERDVISAFAFR
jgi:hypothetical protein